MPWLVASFILGILAADRLSVPSLPFFLFAFGCLLLLLYRPKFLAAMLLFALLGAGWASQRFLPADAVGLSTERLGSYELIITGPVQFGQRGIRVAADLLVPIDASQGYRRIPTQLSVYQGVPELRTGDLVRVWGRMAPLRGYRNPGAPDRQRQAQREGHDRSVQAEQAEAVVVVGQARGLWPLRPLELLRYQLRSFFTPSPPSDSSPSSRPSPKGGEGVKMGGFGLLRALIIGDRSGLSDAQTEAFRRAGLAHLLAISGQHVGLVALVFFILFRGIFSLIPRLALFVPLQKLAWLAAWFPAVAYVGLAGCPVSAVRALLLMSVLVIAYLFQRSRELWSALAVAALVILLWEPSSLFRVSFQLSFIAVAAIILFVEQLGRGVRARLYAMLRTSVAVTLVTAPLVAYYFQDVPFAGLIANLFALPWLALFVLPLTLLTACLALVSVTMGTTLLSLADLAATLLSRLAEAFAALDWTLSLSLRPGQVLLCYGAFLAWFGWRTRWWRRVVLVVAALAIMLGAERAVLNASQAATLQLTMLDVGQGDAMVLRLPSGAHYLIDGGGFYIPSDRRDFPVTDIGERVLLPYLRRQGVTVLEGVVLTHPHPDHFEGLLRVAQHIPIQNFYWSGDAFPDSSFKQLLQVLRKQGATMHQVDATTPPLRQQDLTIRWLGSALNLGQDLNDHSLVMRIDYRRTCILLTGDIEAVAEQRLVGTSGASPLHCDVLKVPHHGSHTSSTRSFLQAVQAKHALVSVGSNNPFGHPAPAVLARYQELGIPVWRTDQHGAITVESDGDQIKVKTIVP